jgi:hypothetical protein
MISLLLLPKNILVLLNIFIYLFLIVSFELSQQLLIKYHFRKKNKNKKSNHVSEQIGCTLITLVRTLLRVFFFFLSNTPFNIYMSKVVLLCILREKYGFFQVLKVCIKKDKKKKN